MNPLSPFTLITPLLAAAPAPAGGDDAPAHVFEPSSVEPLLFWAVQLGIVVIILGVILCLYRLLRGPHLADRVLAADALALHVVGLVILLSILLRTTVFFDAVLVIAILGFVSTVGFSQYICGLCERRDAGDPDVPRDELPAPDSTAAPASSPREPAP